MPDCKKLDPLVTPYVDHALDEANRAALDAHVRVCPPCHWRVAAEREVRELLQARKRALQQDAAPGALRAKCAGIAAGVTADLKVRTAPDDPGVVQPPSRLWRFGEPRRSLSGGGAFRPARDGSPATWGARLTPYALAATLVLGVGGAFVYELTDRSVRIMAAELTADHVKCFGLNRVLGTHDAPAAVEGSMASAFAWPLHLPDRPERAGLELVGARPCLYGEGRVAHIMYRHDGHPVSVFMLPRSRRTESLVEVLGHEAAVWSIGDRTFVLIAREPRADVERMASFVHSGLR